MKLRFRKLTPHTKSPEKDRTSDAGIDFFAESKVRINGHSCVYVSTGIAVEIPKGYRLIAKDRSGFSKETCCFVKAGVIDEEYRGEIKVLIYNGSPYPVIIDRGRKFVQFKLEENPEIILEEADILSETDRGNKGFGSSGA